MKLVQPRQFKLQQSKQKVQAQWKSNLTAGDFDLIQESLNDARDAIHGNDTASALAELETAQDEILSLSNETGG